VKLASAPAKAPICIIRREHKELIDALVEGISTRVTCCCGNCGSTQRQLGAGKAPGQSSLLCQCGKLIKWIDSSELGEIAQQLNKEVL
jgi:hypothetical protein